MLPIPHPTSSIVPLPAPHRAAPPRVAGLQSHTPTTGAPRSNTDQNPHRLSPSDEAALLFEPFVPRLPQPPTWADKASAAGMALLAGGGLGAGLDVALGAFATGPTASTGIAGAGALLGAALGVGMAAAWTARAQTATQRGAALARALDSLALQQAGAGLLFAMFGRAHHPSTRDPGRYHMVWAACPAGMALVGFHHAPLPSFKGHLATPRDLLRAGHGRAQPWGSLPRLPLVAWEQACPGVDGSAWRRDHAHLPSQTLVTVPVPLLGRAEDVAAWRERLDAVESTARPVGDGEASVPARVG